MRLVLYVSKDAVVGLGKEATKRTAISGIEVTEEGVARALVYGGLGLDAKGQKAGEVVGPWPVTGITHVPPSVVLRDPKWRELIRLAQEVGHAFCLHEPKGDDATTLRDLADELEQDAGGGGGAR
jgi:hypothetical protein